MSGPLVAGDQRLADHISAQYAARMQALSNDLLHGTLSLDDWQTRMQDAIRLAYLHQAVAGTTDDDARELTSADYRRIEADIARQYEFLHKFAGDIEQAVIEPGASLDFVPSRAAMYAGSSESEYWRQATDVELPAMPRDGSTRCLGNCQCSWDLQHDADGNVLATWVLGDADHCPDCEQRAEEWNPLVIATRGD